jgi:hypothetical protein
MTTWAAFAEADPELAHFALHRLGGKVSFLATIRADGSPRLHPVTPHVGEGELFVYMDPGSPKIADLRRDPRYALHCSVADSGGGDGEVAVRGRATTVEDGEQREALFAIARAAGFSPRDEHVVFTLGVDGVIATTYDERDDAVRRRWP